MTQTQERVHAIADDALGPRLCRGALLTPGWMLRQSVPAAVGALVAAGLDALAAFDGALRLQVLARMKMAGDGQVLRHPHPLTAQLHESPDGAVVVEAQERLGQLAGLDAVGKQHHVAVALGPEHGAVGIGGQPLARGLERLGGRFAARIT